MVGPIDNPYAPKEKVEYKNLVQVGPDGQPIPADKKDPLDSPSVSAAKDYLRSYSELLSTLDKNAVVAKDKDGKDITVSQIQKTVDEQKAQLNDRSKATAVVESLTIVSAGAFLSDDNRDKNKRSAQDFKDYLRTPQAVENFDKTTGAVIELAGKDTNNAAKIDDLKKKEQVLVSAIGDITDLNTDKYFEAAKAKIEKEGKKSFWDNLKDQHQGDFIGMVIGMLEKAFPKMFGGDQQQETQKTQQQPIIGKPTVDDKGNPVVFLPDVDPAVASLNREARKDDQPAYAASSRRKQQEYMDNNQATQLGFGVVTLPYRIAKGAVGGLVAIGRDVGRVFKKHDKNPGDDISASETEFLKDFGSNAVDKETYRDLVNDKHSAVHKMIDDLAHDGNQIDPNVKRAIAGESVNLNSKEQKTFDLIQAAAKEMRQSDVIHDHSGDMSSSINNLITGNQTSKQPVNGR